MTLEARRGSAAKETARHFGFLGGEHGDFFGDVRERLARKRLKEPHQFAKLVLVLRKRERWHAQLPAAANAVAVRVVVGKRRMLEEAQQPLDVDARGLGEQMRMLLCLLLLIE